jgi:hypothetical protein
LGAYEYIEEEQTTQWPKEKVQKDKQRSTKHTYKTKNRVTRTAASAIKWREQVTFHEMVMASAIKWREQVIFHEIVMTSAIKWREQATFHEMVIQ